MVTALLLIVGFAWAQTTASSSMTLSPTDRAELERLERVWNEAHERGDAAALDALWAPDLIVTVPGMPVMRKADSLAIWTSGRMRFERYATSALEFRVLGDTAIVNGRVERERIARGTRAIDDWLFMKVYQRQSGAWRVVAWQASASPATAAEAAAPVGKRTAAPELSAAWNALLGDWKGEGDGTPGSGAGGESFQFDLEKRVLIRRGTSDYPAAGGRPATHHEDLIVIYPGPAGDASAIYFDNEGHVIRYSATWSADGQTLVFLSAAEGGTPQYRLTYAMLGASRLKVQFEVAPPGGGPFAQYVSGTMTRTSLR